MVTTTSVDLAYQSATADASSQYAYATAHCTVTPYLTYTEPYSSGWTYKQILELVAGIGSLLCIITAAVLIFTHLAIWVRPNEQKQIVRIILFAPIFAIFNFFALWFYNVSWILTPFPELYECFALVAIFYLMVLYVSPDEDYRETFFHHLQRLGRYKQQPKHSRGSLRWFQVTWVLVFQILPSKLAINIVIWALNASMCPIKYAGSTASTGVSVVQSLVTVACVLAILGFHARLKKQMDGHHVLLKLVTFKGVVGIVLLQTPIFSGLAEHRVFQGTKNVSIVDFAIGTPSFLICVEMFIVTLLFLWSFSASEYKNLAKSQNLRREGAGKALLDVVDIRDILKGCWYMFRILVGGGSGRPVNSPSTGLMKGDDVVNGSNVALQQQPSPPLQQPPQYHNQQQQQQYQQPYQHQQSPYQQSPYQ